jgi:hypothetical protein
MQIENREREKENSVESSQVENGMELNGMGFNLFIN